MRLHTIISIIAITIASITDCRAAKIVMRDMKLLPTDQTAINPETTKKAQNGETSALLKIYTKSIKAGETYFDNGVMGIMGQINKNNEIWLYIPAGSQNLKVFNPNYEPLDWWFGEEILPGKTYSAILTVEGKDVTISASVRNAPLYVDNDSIGLSPQTIYLSYGEHNIITDQQPMHGEKRITVTQDSPSRIEITMEDRSLKYSDVTITSPDGAEIWFEGQRTGVGVFRKRLESGDYTVEFRKPNHETQTLPFTANAGYPTEIMGPRLLPYRGILKVAVFPATGTRIMDDDTIMAMNRIDKSLDVGSYTYTFKRNGYRPKIRTYQVVRNETTTDTVIFKPTVRPNVVHMSIGYAVELNLSDGDIGAPGYTANIGATIRNFDIDFGYLRGLFKYDAYSVKVGWQCIPGLQFKAAEHVGLTPQLGYLLQHINGDKWADDGISKGAVCHNLSFGLKFVFGISPLVGLAFDMGCYYQIGSNDKYNYQEEYEVSITNEYGYTYTEKRYHYNISKFGMHMGLGLIFNIGLR